MYELLGHTADEKFRVRAGSLEEAFSEVTRAFSEVVKGDRGSGVHSVSVESESLEALLFDFLDRLIFLQDTEGVAVSHAESLDVEETENGYRLEADVAVDSITSGMNFTDVKAPTYNEMRVDYEDGQWVLEAVLDV
ncbi:MAG: archease [Candidatus Nanohalobium sp.]